MSLFIPTEAYEDLTPLDGTVIATGPAGQARLAVKIRGRDDWMRSGWRWLTANLLVAALIPGLLTLELGYLGFMAQQSAQARREERRAFETVTYDKDVFPQLKGLFTKLLPNLDKDFADDPQEWCTAVEQQLQQKNQFERMPKRELLQLLQAFRTGNRRVAYRMLKSLYPVWLGKNAGKR